MINLQATLDKGRKKNQTPVMAIKPKKKVNEVRDKKFQEIKENIKKRDKNSETVEREA